MLQPSDDRDANMAMPVRPLDSSSCDDLEAELDEMLHRSLLEIGRMEEIQDQMKEVSARISKLTPKADSAA
jgi:hypothetical protein